MPESTLRPPARRPPDSRSEPRRRDDLRRQEPGHEFPADRAAPAAGRRAERAGRAARRRRLRLVERLRRAVPDPELRAPGGQRAQVQPLPHDRALLADAAGAAHGSQSSRGRHGRDHGDRDLRAGLQLDPAEDGRAAGGDAEAERLLDRAVRQVPRGPGLGDEPDGPVRRLAERRRRVRALLRLHRRRDEPVRPGALRRHASGRAGPHAGGGLPLHRGHDRPRDRLDPPAEGADAGQAVLRLLRAGRDPCAAPRAGRVVGQVQGQVRPGLGQAPRGDLRAPEGARRHPAGRRADCAAEGDPGLGRDAGRDEADLRPPDGGLRRLHGAHRPPRRPRDRRARGARAPRGHARLRDRRRQRRLGRGNAERLLQRADRPQRRRAASRRSTS